VYDLCKWLNILFIADEIKMGMGKTGKFFSFQNLGGDCKPDLVTVGKSITGGAYPASFVLGDNDVMSLIGAYECASTFAAAPLGIAAAEAAIAVLDDEDLVQRATCIGSRFEREVESWHHQHIQRVSARGADMRIWIKESDPSGRVSARRICALCLHNKLLLYPRGPVMRMSAPLVITDAELDMALATIRHAMDHVTDYGHIPGEKWHRS
jgi:ornithine--oxo-acid transaminase